MFDRAAGLARSRALHRLHHPVVVGALGAHRIGRGRVLRQQVGLAAAAAQVLLALVALAQGSFIQPVPR